LAAICSLIKEFHWTIEYVSSLTWTQIETFNKGLGDLHMQITPDSEKTADELANDADYQQRIGDSIRNLVNKDTGQVDIMKILKG